MRFIAYALTAIGTLIGGWELFSTMVFAESAPQQGAGAAMALAWAVLPYCFARAVEKLGETPLAEVLNQYFPRRGERVNVPSSSTLDADTRQTAPQYPAR